MWIARTIACFRKRNSYSVSRKMEIRSGSQRGHYRSSSSPSVLEEIQHTLKQPLQTVFPIIPHISPAIARASSDSAHYQCNNAFSIAKQLNMESREVAELIAKSISSADFLDRVEVVGKGFINLTLKKSYIGKRLLNCAEIAPTSNPKRVLIDYASPNMSKALHVGHMRTILIGDCVARLLERLGHSVERISHVGDFGTPIAMVLTHLFEAHPKDWRDWLRKASADDLSELYVQAKGKSKECEEKRKSGTSSPADFSSRVSETLAQMQKDISLYRASNNTISDPSEAFEGWMELCESSRRGYMPLMKLLGVSDQLREQGESYYVNMLDSVVRELLERRIASQKDGAVTVFLKQPDIEPYLQGGYHPHKEKEKEVTKEKTRPAKEKKQSLDGDGTKGKKKEDDAVDVVVQKQDGTHLYATTDLAALRERARSHDWLIYVVDRSQKTHLASVFEIGRRAKWFSPQCRIDHLDFGVVQGEDGKKLSSRDGNAAPLQWLVNRSIEEAHKVLLAADTILGAEITSNVTPENIRTTAPVRAGTSVRKPRSTEETAADAKALGIASLKYFELAQHYASNYVFSLPKMMAFKGNTVVYLNYAYSRIQSIDRQVTADKAPSSDVFQLEHPTELALAVKLIQFQEIVQSLEHSLAPSQLCLYLYDLSSKFHSFYEQCRVVGSPQQASRVALCNTTKMVLLRGMDLLGVTPIERM